MDETASQDELVGLGGWLMLFIVGLIFQLLDSLPTIAGIGRADFSEPWRLLKVMVILAIWIGTVGSLILVFAKSRYCPRFVIGYLALGVIANIAYVAELKSGGGGTFATKAGLAVSTVKCVAWILYFLTSRRVRNTFHGVPQASGGLEGVDIGDSKQ